MPEDVIVAGEGNFIHDIIEADFAAGRANHVHTRFPPEPNGCMHIGSAKAIIINYEAAKKYGGLFNLRFDDTNPAKEDDSFVKSIIDDISWLIGGEPDGGIFYGSDYFPQCYEYAEKLIRDGKAYVCDLSQEEMAAKRGTLTRAGENSPFRERSAEENLDLFHRMRDGEFSNGHCTLRAKIDMTSSNMNMRDPAIYRISHVAHHRQGDKWCVYPLYDYAHPIQDAIEGITHSCCSLEFENHRPLYDWVIDNIGIAEEKKPHQYEFARLNVTYTVMSKRYLIQMVERGFVDGWDDPRMPTLAGLRRRGYSPEAIRAFVRMAGVSKAYSVVDVAMLEYCIREELNAAAQRRIAIKKPIPVVITNYPEGQTELFPLQNLPGTDDVSTRDVPFTRELYIDADDFAEVPPPKFFRLSLGREVRLMGAYIIRCDEVVRDDDGEIVRLKCTADLSTGGKNPADGRKVKGTIHWLSKNYAVDTTIVDYDRLFTIENVFDIPEDKDYDDYLNPNSIVEYPGAKLEACAAGAKPGEKFQFVRNGYYCVDSKIPERFISVVPLKSSFKPN